MKAILEWANDYRDTLFYSAVLVGATFALATGHNVHDTLDAVVNWVWRREFVRMLAWTAQSPRHYRVAFFVTISLNIVQFFMDAGTIIPHAHKHPWLTTIFIAITLANLVLATGCILLAGGVKPLLKTYWKDLFDWPRKQKPPKHRWETAKRKIYDTLEKFRPDFLPSPTGC